MMLLPINSSPKLSSKISDEKRITLVVTRRKGGGGGDGSKGVKYKVTEGDVL